jgi:hypothetical protein
MEYLGLTMFAAVILTGVWLLTGRRTRTRRNEGGEQGGGLDGCPSGVPYM